MHICMSHTHTHTHTHTRMHTYTHTHTHTHTHIHTQGVVHTHIYAIGNLVRACAHGHYTSKLESKGIGR